MLGRAGGGLLPATSRGHGIVLMSRRDSNESAEQGRENLPSGTSSSPLSVAMIAVVEEEKLDQAQLDLVIDYRGWGGTKKKGRRLKRAATGVKRKLVSSRFVRSRKI